jgi:hypothetical protein
MLEFAAFVKFLMCIFNEIVISKCPSRTMTYRSGAQCDKHRVDKYDIANLKKIQVEFQ